MVFQGSLFVGYELLACTYVMPNMTCYCVVATVFNNAYQHINVYGDDIEVDYRGYEVHIKFTIKVAPSVLLGNFSFA